MIIYVILSVYDHILYMWSVLYVITYMICTEIDYCYKHFPTAFLIYSLLMLIYEYAVVYGFFMFVYIHY